MMQNPDDNNQFMFEAAYQAFKNKEYGEAFELFEQLLKSPGLTKELRANCYYLQGETCFILNDYDEAIKHLDKLLKIGEFHHGYITLGKIYRELGLYKKSIINYEKAIQIHPGEISDYMGLASTFRKIYDDQSAVKMYRKILDIDPNFAKAYRNMSLCMTYESIDHPDRIKVESLLKEGNLSHEDMSQCHYALGKIYNDCDEYDLAFKHFEQGNNIRGKTRPFDIKNHATKILNQMNTFNKTFYEHFEANGCDSEKPVFIIGISRAGKTLVERLINQHKSVSDKEELAVFNKLIGNVIDLDDPYHFEQEVHNVFTQETVDKLTQSYLTQLNRDTGKDILKITDTTPCNYRYIGFLHMMFPKAKFIFCRRHPLDHGLQVFFKYYKSGHRFTYDLKTLGKYYVHYLEIMNHWEQVMPDNIMTVQYENMIADPISTQKEILSFIGLDINDSLSGDLTITPKEVERWKHFEAYLKPLKKALKGYLP